MTKRLKIILIALAGLMILVGAGAWYAASKVDPARLTQLLIDSVKTATGRDLTISGPVTLSFFPKISVSAERLSLSNAAWSHTPEMLTLKRIEIDIKTLPLLREQIEIASVKLSGLELFLQKNASGKANWKMNAATSGVTDPINVVAPDRSSGGDQLMFMENISVLDTQIWYQDAMSPATSYQIKNLSLAQGGDKTSISLSMRLQDQAIELTGKTGSFSSLFKQWDVSSSHFPLDLNLTVNGKSMMIQGEVNKIPKGIPSIDLTLNSKSFDWPTFGMKAQLPAKAQQGLTSAEPVALQVRQPQSNYLFSNEDIPFDVLPQVQGRVVINIAELNLPKRKPIENLQATLQLGGGVIDIPRLTLQMGKGSADIQIKLSEFNTTSPMLLAKGVTKDFTLENLSARIDPGSKVSGGNMKLAFDIKTSGMNLHQFAANSNGKIQLSVTQARMGTNFLNDAGDFVVTLLDSMNPMRKKTSETILECAVAYLPVKNGQINIANTVGAQTDRLDIVLAGSINLKTEAVNLTVDPREKSGLTTGIDLAGMVKMGGTLMHPKVGINQAGVVNSAVSIGLGLLTGGASILAENARSMTNKGHPCQDALHPWSDIYPGAQ